MESPPVTTRATEIIHRSKIGFEILLPLLVILGAVTIILVINAVWPGLIVCALVILFVVHIYTSTYYKITPDNRLFIKCGILESYDIAISEIEWIKSSRELTNAPALSVDRLEIGYKSGRVLVSPREKRKFVEDLRTVNPKIWWTGT